MATYYFRNTGDVNWGTATNWSLTDGGGATGAVPTAADDAYFTSNSGNCTVNASARVCKTLIFAGVGAGDYTGTVTMTNGITVSGNITLSATMGNFLGTGSLTINATATYDSNTKTFPNTLIIADFVTVTLAENATVGGLTTASGSSGTTLNNNNLYITGSLTGNNIALSGTTTLHLTGTGTWLSSNLMRNNLTINTSGTITFSGTVGYGGSASTPTLTYTAGTLVTTGSTLNLKVNVNITSNNVNWGAISVNDATSITFNDNCYCTNFTTASGSNGVTFLSNNLYITGNLTHNNVGTVAAVNNTVFNLTGTGTWSGDNNFRNNLIINTSGTITLSGNVGFGGTAATRTLTYTAGSLVTTGSTLAIKGSVTLVSNGINWGAMSIVDNITMTLSDNATITNFTSIGPGSAGITINSNNLYITGNLTNNNIALIGTTTLNLTGTGTWSGNNQVRNPLVINTVGTITLSGTVRYGGGGATPTLTFTAGTISPGTSTLSVDAGITYAINSSGFALWNYSPATGTHTIQGSNGLITVNNNMTLNGNTTFAGTGGWTVANISDTTAGRTLTLKDGSTYTITNAMTLTGTNASPFVVASSSATLRAILTLNYGASQTVQFVRATRIDSSGGQTIWDTVGTIVTPLTDTINWNSGSRPAPFNSIRMG